MQAGGKATRGAGCPIVSLPHEVAEPQVVGEVLADDARTATPPRGTVEGVVTSPPVADMRVGSPSRTFEGVGTSAGDVGATTSPTIIDVDPIRTVPGGAEDMVRDQP
jgi:hypothetical protein